MAKNAKNHPVTEELAVPVELLVEAAVGLPEAAVPPVAAKRSLGVKEPIVFLWKVVGASEGMTVTLFKSVGREEAEAQLDRLRKEGYYSDVKLLEVTVRTEPPPPAKTPPKPVPRPETPVAVKTRPPSPPSRDTAKRASKPAARGAKKSASVKPSRAKPGPKAPRKKSPAAASPPKKPAKGN